MTKEGVDFSACTLYPGISGTGQRSIQVICCLCTGVGASGINENYLCALSLPWLESQKKGYPCQMS